jgi:acyl-CoA thioester hydrolase
MNKPAAISGEGEKTPAHFTLPIRVYYEDTDAGGVVYNANYLCFAERARTEMLRIAGINQSALRKVDQIIFVMTKVEIRYKRPAMLDDMLAVQTHLISHSKTRMLFNQDIYKNGKVITHIEVELACVKIMDGENNFKAHPIPQMVLDAVRLPGIQAE